MPSIATRAVYRPNSGGLADPDRHTPIWTAAVPGDEPEAVAARQLTEGDFDEQGFVWSPDGQDDLLHVESRGGAVLLFPRTAIFTRSPLGRRIVRIASIDGTIGALSPSRDGKRLAFIGSVHGKTVRSYNQPDLYVTDATPAPRPAI